MVVQSKSPQFLQLQLRHWLYALQGGEAMTSQKVDLVQGVGWHAQKEKVKNVHLLEISQLHGNFQGVIIIPLVGLI